MRLITVPCPLCGQSNEFIDVEVSNTDVHIQKYGSLYSGQTRSQWKVCGQCGFIHQNPRPSIEAINEYYSQSKYHIDSDECNVEEHLRFSKWYFTEKIEFAISHSHLTNGGVFDIGCGRGGVLKLFEERGWKSYGLEPDENLARFAINKMGLSGVLQGMLDSNFKLGEKVNLVFTNHAFEHFADLDEVIKGVLNILELEGYLFIAIPTYFRNRSSLSKAWMNSAHYSLFTHHSLNNMLCKYGFEEVTHTYSGWNKEIDDLWYIAKYTGQKTNPGEYYENPQTVSRYIGIINPLRSLFFFPVYSNWAMRVRCWNFFMNAIKIFFRSPSTFFRKTFRFITRKKQS